MNYLFFMEVSMKKGFIKAMVLAFSIITSAFINTIYIDSLLDVFSIMSSVALFTNRVALALFLYFCIERFLIERQIKGGITDLFITY